MDLCFAAMRPGGASAVSHVLAYRAVEAREMGYSVVRSTSGS